MITTGYALLILPSANRVYAQAAALLGQAELEVFNRRVLGGRVSDLAVSTIGGVPYLTFSCQDFTARDTALLANLSCSYALFAFDGERLRPVPLQPLDRFDSDLLTIQKYPGKTNEQFTKLLLNVTLLSSAFATQLLERRFSVLDPLCGRGTTLNQAMMYGFDAAGLDVDARDVEAYAGFIQRWLKDKRIKHRAGYVPVRRNRKLVARRLRVSLAASKQEYQAGRLQQLDVVNADTTRALEFFRPGSVDLVVTDAPYGVQHGSRSPATALARSPLELLAEAIPVWAQLLRAGGAIGLAWNTLVARRDDVAGIMSSADLEVLSGEPYLGFRHRVDRAIVRDILIARKS